MNRIVKILAPVAVLAGGAAVVALLSMTKPEPEKKDEVSQAPSLFVEAVKRQQVTLKVVTQAEVKANTEIDLISQVGGIVKSVSSEYVEGGSFAVGETLVTIDDADYLLALKRAEAQVAAALVRVEQVQADAQVAKRQLRGVKNPSALALKKPQIAEAKANLKAAEADQAQAELNLSRTKISLPFKGRLKSIEVNIGQYITAGSNLGRAFATDKVKLRLALTDRQLAKLRLPIGYIAKAGEAPQVEVSALVAGRQSTWTGRLTRVDAAFDQSTRLLYAVAEVVDPYDYPMPLAVGLYVTAEIYGETLEQALVVPRAALREGKKVYVVDKDKNLDIREVQVVDSSSATALIEGAIQEGELVIVSPIRNPAQGMAVNTMVREEKDAHSPTAKEVSHNG